MPEEKRVIRASEATFGKRLFGGFQVKYFCPNPDCGLGGVPWQALVSTDSQITSGDKCPWCECEFDFDEQIKQAYASYAGQVAISERRRQAHDIERQRIAEQKAKEAEERKKIQDIERQRIAKEKAKESEERRKSQEIERQRVAEQKEKQKEERRKAYKAYQEQVEQARQEKIEQAHRELAAEKGKYRLTTEHQHSQEVIQIVEEFSRAYGSVCSFIYVLAIILFMGMFPALAILSEPVGPRTELAGQALLWLLAGFLSLTFTWLLISIVRPVFRILVAIHDRLPAKPDEPSQTAL